MTLKPRAYSLLLLLCFFIDNLQAQEFQNPVLPGFYPDPSICRVGEDYYLTTSTFHYWPGLPVFHSRDLVNWQQIGHALHRPEQINYNGYKPSKGIFAPTIRYHNGTFYIITTMVGDDVYAGPNFILTAKNPAGPWSDPIIIKGAPGIDPSLFFDDDGRLYYVGKRYATTENCLGLKREIWLQELDTTTYQLIGQSKALWSGTGGIHPEGPHIYKRNGWYYLMLAEGGTGYNHAETIARSRNIEGPYQPNPCNPLITSRHLGKQYPINNPGHADLIQTQNGQWYAVLLASRKIDDQWFHNLGRETFLVPVSWQDDWPVFSPGTGRVEASYPLPDLPVAKKTHHQRFDHFNDPETPLPLYWNHIHIPETEDITLSKREGYLALRLKADSLESLKAPAFAGRRQQHFNFTVQTRMSYTLKKDKQEAGLVATHNENCYYRFVVRRENKQNHLQLIQRINNKGIKTLKRIPITGKQIDLKMVFNGLKATLFYGTKPNDWQEFMSNVDLSILSPEIAWGFVGTYIGLYASGNGNDSREYIYFDHFIYSDF